MAQKTDNLSQEIVDKLKSMQTNLNLAVASLGQIHLKIRDTKSELTSLEEEQKNIENQFDVLSSEYSNYIGDLEKTYPNGEIDLNTGLITYDSPE